MTRLYLGVVFALILASLGSVRNLPWFYPIGIDFHNVHTFQNCSFVDRPYDVPGRACGDLLDRAMLYPPPLLSVFRWARGLDFTPAYLTWVGVIFLGMALSLALWRISDLGLSSWRETPILRRILTWWLGALYLISFPAAFALERGNNDVLVLVLWSVGFALLVRFRPVLAGAAFGASVLLKLYPIFGAVVLGLTLLRKRTTQASALRVGAAAIAVGVLGFFAQHALWMQYLREVLPGWSNVIAGNAVFAHSLYAPFHDQQWIARALSALLLFAWIFAALKARTSDQTLVISGGLAISTFFAKTSNDYNLITAYPLLFILTLRAIEDRNLRGWALWGTLALIGHRGWWMGKATGHTLFLYSFLLIFGVWLAKRAPSNETPR